MIFLLRNIVVYAYSENGSKLEIDELITELKINCSLDKPYQQVNFTIPYGVSNEWFPHYFIDTGTKIELYDIYGEAVFRGTVNKVTLNSKNQTLECVVYDYIYNICQDGVYYNFKGMSAFNCICKMFDDLQVPYNLYDLSDKWDESNPDFVDQNCRITAFRLFKNFITSESNLSYDKINQNNLEFDLVTLKDNPNAKFSKEPNRYE